MKKNSRSSNNSRTAKNLRQLKRKLSRRQRASAEFQYQALEPKLPLDASFSYSEPNGGRLSFGNFTGIGADESVRIDLNNDGDLIATLTNGVWLGGFADPDDGANLGQTLVVEGDFDDFFIGGLANGSVVTFGGNTDFSDVELSISSPTDFTVVAGPSGTNQSGFDVDVLRITGGTIQINDPRSEIGNLIVNDVTAFQYDTDNTITVETITSAAGGSVILSTDADVILNSVNVPGTLTLLVDGNVTRDIRDNDVFASQFYFDVDGNIAIENLRVTEISGDVDGDFTITDSNNNFTNLTDTTITADFVPGLAVDGDLDWTIRGTSLTQNPDAPLRLSGVFGVIDSPFLSSDDDAGTATFRVTPFTQTETILLAESDFNDFGELNVISDFPNGLFGYRTSTNVPRLSRFNALEFSDVDSIVIGDLQTNFVPSDLGQNDTGLFDSRVRISAGRGVIAGEDFPVLVGNQIGNITITGQIEAENLLLQSPGIFDASAADIDTHNLFLGGDAEIESRANFQIVADSLQNLSVNVFDSFDVVTQQELRIGAGQYLGLNTLNPEVYTTAFANEFARVESTRLDFDVPFTTRKLVADVVTDVEQAAGAVVTIDELSVEAKRTVLDNPANDFQRIAVLGDGFADFFTAGISNNDEDVLVIRDVGTLEIASLDDQPIDAVTTNFPNTQDPVVIDGISIDGTVDIVTGFGGAVTIPRTGGPTAEQLGPNGRIERFTAVPGRTDIVFRDDNYDGSVRPAYFIEFIYDGVTDLGIRSDPFERRDPERVRGPLDIELALFNEAGDLLAVDDDDSNNEFDVLNLNDIDPEFLFNGSLPAGRYYVAASAFATEFEDGFVVNTNNNQTGTINVSIANGAVGSANGAVGSANGASFVAPELGRDLTQQPTAPLIVTGGEEDGDIEDGEPDGSVVLSALNGGAILLAESELNDVRLLTVDEAVGIEFTDADDAIIVSNVTTPYDFARLSAGRAGEGGMLTVGDFASDELLIQADTGVVTTGEIDVRRLLIGGSEARDSGGDIALISPNTEELAFQFVNRDTDLALATNQDLVIGAFESRGGVLIDGSVGDEIRLQANSLAINSPLQATTKLVVEVAETLELDASTFVDPFVDNSADYVIPDTLENVIPLGGIASGSAISIDTFTSTVDTELTLFDNTGVVIGQNDNFNPGVSTDSQIQFADLPDGAYVLAVSGSFSSFRDGFVVFGGDSAGDYNLNVNDLSASGLLAANEVVFYSFNVGDVTVPRPEGPTAIITDQLYFTGETLDLSQVNNAIGSISAATNGEDGDFLLRSSITTNVAMLDNQIDVGELPTSDTLSFNPANTLEGVTTPDDITFNVARLTQDEGSVLRGDVLTITTTGQRGTEVVTDPNGPIVLPTGPEVDNGTTIDNDVATDIAGSFETNVGDGNGVSGSQLTYEQLDGSLATGDLVFNYTTYVRIGDTTTDLAATTITQAATLIADDVVESRGSFTGPNGLVTWIAQSSFEDGIATFLSSLELQAAAGTTLGDIQIISYLDEDIQSVSDDFLTTTGTAGEADFRAFTLDGPNRIGFSHGGFYIEDGTNQINATYAGWAADQFSQLQTAIQGSTQDFSIGGTIDLTDLPILADDEFFPAFGPEDVTTAFAWNTVATETNSTITSFLEFLPTVESVTGEPTDPLIPFGDVVLDQSNSINRLIVPSANGVSFTNDRQFVTETIDAFLDVALATEAGDVVVQTIETPENVTLTAADDIRDTDAQDGNRVAGATLNLVAGNNVNEDPQFNGILLQTNADVINASVNSTDSGDVILRELNDVNLGTVVAGNGFIDVVAIGTISADDVSHTTQNETNTITLIAVGDDSDISLGSLSAGGAANIRLIAGDDVNHLAGATTQLVTADDLFVLADNKTADDNSGINLNTNIVSGDFQVGRGPDQNPNPGAITIDEANGLRLDYAKTRLGTVNITAGGTINSDFVQAEGINTGDAITLTANGVGADVVTNEVRVRLSTGGVAINADDDIRDVNSSDERFIIASSVTLRAGNNSEDTFNGIIAQTRTNLISAQVTSDTNASMFIFNRNALRLEDTFVTNGNIGVTNTGGNLQAANVRTGGQANSRIFFRTLGVGSDISLSRVEAADRGEIFLDSADDIFDSVFADDLFVTAEFLSATARNNAIEAFDGVILSTEVDSLFITQPNGGEKFIREV